MTEEHHTPVVDKKDRGIFDFLGKKEEEKPFPEVIISDFEKIKVSEREEEEEEEEKEHSSSSSSSDEDEEGEKKEKKKKKKGLKEKITGENSDQTTVPIEKYEDSPAAPHPEDKKGFLEKVKEKLLPGQKEAAVATVTAESTQVEEKKGILEKIKEKLPGYHPKNEASD